MCVSVIAGPSEISAWVVWSEAYVTCGAWCWVTWPHTRRVWTPDKHALMSSACFHTDIMQKFQRSYELCAKACGNFLRESHIVPSLRYVRASGGLEDRMTLMKMSPSSECWRSARHVCLTPVDEGGSEAPSVSCHAAHWGLLREAERFIRCVLSAGVSMRWCFNECLAENLSKTCAQHTSRGAKRMWKKSSWVVVLLLF